MPIYIWISFSVIRFISSVYRAVAFKYPVESEPASEDSSELAGHCVLVIDDEELVRNATKAMLEFRHAFVLAAESGAAALEILETSPIRPSLIILDLTMPGLSGEETLVEIRKNYPGIPVIVSSGHPIDMKDFDSFPGGGPDEIIPKPYTLKTFMKVVDSVLNR